MVRFAQYDEINQLKKLWKISFGDTDKYIDFIFRNKFDPLNTLVYYTQNKIVASLQMQQYVMRLYGQTIPFYYLAGLGTHPEYRNKGLMKLLIDKSFEIMRDRKIPLSILVPAEEWLYKYYNKFGFVETFEKGTDEIELKNILKNSRNIEAVFDIFDRKYQQKDFCVLKNIDDFKIIIEEYIDDDYPPKFNLRAMSAIVDLKEILKLYAKSRPNTELVLETYNFYTSQSIQYYINKGLVSEITETSNYDCIRLNIGPQLLTKLLFGIIPAEESNSEKYEMLFDKHSPIINLMLE